MAQIANVRRFNGSSDEIQLAATDYNTTVGAQTFAAIVKKANDTGFGSLISVSGGAGGEFTFQQNGSRTSLWHEPNTTSSSSAYWEAAMGWCLVAISRADGNSTVRHHRYRYDTQTWDHTDGGTLTETASPSGASLWLGTYNGSLEWMAMDLAVVGVFPSALSDGTLEGLTSGIGAWESASPTGLWMLNQSTVTPITDRVGNGDEIAINGTTVASVSPSELPFDDGTGVVGAPTPPRAVQSSLRW